MKTGVNATKLAIAAFIVPYIFAMNPQMLFVDVSSSAAGGADLHQRPAGIFGVAAALNGFLYRTTSPLLRLILVVGGLGMLIPGHRDRCDRLRAGGGRGALSESHRQAAGCGLNLIKRRSRKQRERLF